VVQDRDPQPPSWVTVARPALLHDAEASRNGTG
jgi:hypothetical protein